MFQPHQFQLSAILNGQLRSLVLEGPRHARLLYVATTFTGLWSRSKNLVDSSTARLGPSAERPRTPTQDQTCLAAGLRAIFMYRLLGSHR